MIELYVDHVSQPCRACLLFCRSALACLQFARFAPRQASKRLSDAVSPGRINSINIEEKTVSIFKGENKQPEFLALNPLGKLPFLREGDFRLPESAAILRYLATTHKACPVTTFLGWRLGSCSTCRWSIAATLVVSCTWLGSHTRHGRGILVTRSLTARPAAARRSRTIGSPRMRSGRRA